MTLRGPSVGLDSRVFKIVNLQNWVKIDEKNESPQFRDNSFQFCIIWVINKLEKEYFAFFLGHFSQPFG